MKDNNENGTSNKITTMKKSTLFVEIIDTGIGYLRYLTCVFQQIIFIYSNAFYFFVL
jgi:hypothetical protein